MNLKPFYIFFFQSSSYNLEYISKSIKCHRPGSWLPNGSFFKVSCQFKSLFDPFLDFHQEGACEHQDPWKSPTSSNVYGKKFQYPDSSYFWPIFVFLTRISRETSNPAILLELLSTTSIWKYMQKISKNLPKIKLYLKLFLTSLLYSILKNSTRLRQPHLQWGLSFLASPWLQMQYLWPFPIHLTLSKSQASPDRSWINKLQCRHVSVLPFR